MASEEEGEDATLGRTRRRAAPARAEGGGWGAPPPPGEETRRRAGEEGEARRRMERDRIGTEGEGAGWERERGKKEEADKWGPLRVVGIEDDI